MCVSSMLMEHIALSALGYDKVIVMLDPYRYPPILEEDIDSWPYVQSGLIDRIDAYKLFQLYFILDGSERARACFNSNSFMAEYSRVIRDFKESK